VPDGRLATLAATLLPPGLLEAAFSALLLAVILGAGLVSLDALTTALPPDGTVLVVAGAASLGLVAAVVLRRRLERLIRSLRAGVAVLGRPGVVATKVLPWLVAGRIVRLFTFALILTAAGVPFGLAPALALMALQGATPSAGAAATAARIALLAVVLGGTGAADVPPADVAKALAAAYGVTSAVNLTVSAAVIAWSLRTASPLRIVGFARCALQRVDAGLHLERDLPAPARPNAVS
jgi:hypothetical protein